MQCLNKESYRHLTHLILFSPLGYVLSLLSLYYSDVFAQRNHVCVCVFVRVCVCLYDDSTESAEEKVHTYNTALKSLADKHAPQITKLVSKRPKCPWFNDDLLSLKLEKRKLERLWRRTELVVHHQMYRDKCVE